MLITCTDLSPKYTFYYSSLPVAKVRAEILLSMINARIKSPKRVPAGLVNAWDKYANSIFSSVQFGSVHFQGWLGRQELAETVTAAAAAAAERRAAAMFVFGCLRFGCGSLDDKSLPHALPFLWSGNSQSFHFSKCSSINSWVSDCGALSPGLLPLAFGYSIKLDLFIGRWFIKLNKK